MKILEAIINYSCNNQPTIVEAFKDCCVMDVHNDEDYFRMVISVIGEPDKLVSNIIDSAKEALKVVDLNSYKGTHPTIGAIDVVPFVPLENMTQQEAIEISNQCAYQLSLIGIPTFLYELSKEGRLLSSIRKGGLENLKTRIVNHELLFDYGNKLHETGGACVVGVREPMIAYNITLEENNLQLAKQVAKTLRQSNGGLKYVSAIGVYCESRNITQVSFNLRNYKVTSIEEVYDKVAKLAPIASSEIIGCVFKEMISNPHKLKLTRFDNKMIIDGWIFRYKKRECPDM